MATRPNVTQKARNNDRGYLLVRNLQRMLRLYSQRYDGKAARAMIAEPAVADAIAKLFEPLGDLLATLQRVPGSDLKLLNFAKWIEGLFDLCENLRNRVQDPARSIGLIATHLHHGVKDLYTFLHHLANEAPEVLPFRQAYTLLRDLDDQVQFFSLESVPFDKPGAPRPDVNALATDLESLDRKHLLRAQEVFARWIVGDCEEEHSVLTVGDMAGKTRKEPFFPRELPSRLHMPALDGLLPAFRAACRRTLLGEATNQLGLQPSQAPAPTGAER